MNPEGTAPMRPSDGGSGMKRDWFLLTAAQRMIYHMTQEYPEPEVTCLGACMALRADLDNGLLKQCIQMEYGRYDCLRLRFTAPDENGEVMQYIAPYEEMEIPCICMTEITMEEARSRMKSWTRLPFERVDAPMCQFRLVELADGYQGVYLRIDHLLADSCCIIALANDVMELYCHFAFGTPMPGACYSFREAALRELERAQDSVRTAADAAFWRKLIEMGEPVYTDIKGPARLMESRRRHGNPRLRAADQQRKDCAEGQASFFLEPEPAGRLAAYCADNGISMTNLLLMGLRTYLSKQNDGETDISVRNYVSRRFSRLARLSGGTRVHCYPCRTIIGPETGFLNGVSVIQHLQNQIYRHVDYDSDRVLQEMSDAYHAPEHTIYESVALTYQPMPVCLKNESLRGIPYQTMWFSNGTAIQPVYLTVMQNPADSGLEFYVKYQAADYGYEDMENMYDCLMRILFLGVEHPQASVGEIMGWA